MKLHTEFYKNNYSASVTISFYFRKSLLIYTWLLFFTTYLQLSLLLYLSFTPHICIYIMAEVINS